MRSARRTVAVEDGTLHSYVGGWPEYVRVREERRRTPRRRAEARRTQDGRASRQPAAKPKANGTGRRNLETQIEARRGALAAIEAELADPSAWTTRAAPRIHQAPREAKRALEELYAGKPSHESRFTS